MKKKLLKWTLMLFASCLTIIVLFFGWLYYEMVYKPEKDATNHFSKNYPQIEEVSSVNLVSGWGSLPGYSAIVRIREERCRVWFDGDGRLMEDECKRKLE